MADRIQLDGRTYVPVTEAAAISGSSEAQIHSLAKEGRVLLRAIAKKVYVDMEGLQVALRSPGEPELTSSPAAHEENIPVLSKAPLASPAIQPFTPDVSASSKTQTAASVMQGDVPQPGVDAAAIRRKFASIDTNASLPKVQTMPTPEMVAARTPVAPAVPTAPVPAPAAAVITTAPTDPVPPAPPSVSAHVPPAPVPRPAAASAEPGRPKVAHVSSAELSAMGSITDAAALPEVAVASQRGTPGADRTFSTAVAALAALALVLGGIATYEFSPSAVVLAGGLRDQVAAVLGASPITYSAKPAPEGFIAAEGPSENQATAAAATFPGVTGTSSQPIYYVYNYPVIERVVEEVRYIDAQSSADFETQLNELYRRIQSQIQGLNITTNTQFAQQYQIIAQTNNIDQLGSIDINNSIFTDGTISESELRDITSLSVTGGTTLGSLSVGEIAASGSGTFDGEGSFSFITASSTSATSTFSGGILATRAPTVPHTFDSWATGASNSAWWDAALVVNPASAVGDSNLISASVNGSVKFLVDAEGDVFVNNLTSVGAVTLSSTTASTFTVEGNTTLGDSLTDTTTINGSLIVTGSTTVAATQGKFGIGTSTPWASLSVQARSGQTYPVFQVASSSSATAYITVTSSGNVGIGTTSPSATLAVVGSFVTTGTNTFTGALNIAGAITSTATTANTFPYASTTALTVSSMAYLNHASTTQLSVFNNAYFGGSATSTFNSSGALSLVSNGLTVGTSQLVVAGSNVGIGTTTPLRRFAVEQAASAAQLAVAYDASRVTEIQTDSSGDLIINPSGDDTRLNDDNLWVCAGGSCPSGTPSGTGNLIVETKLGIGTSTPTDQLSVEGLLRVGANSVAPVTMGTATSTFNGDIQILGKLDVGTIDPVYTIDGTKYATYGHSTVGIKEEVALKVTPRTWDTERGMYAYVIDFDDLERGSDLWLFYQVTDFGKEWKSLVAALAPAFDGRTYYEENIGENSLTIYASESAPVSVRLIANRFDFSKWSNVRPDQESDFTHFELEEK